MAKKKITPAQQALLDKGYKTPRQLLDDAGLEQTSVRKLKPAFKEAWLAALRSGKYKQTDGKLWDGKKSYCCLGVACDVMGYEKRAGADEDAPHFLMPITSKSKRLAEEESMPSVYVQRKWGMHTVISGYLANVNDGDEGAVARKDRDFATIADYVEAFL